MSFFEFQICHFQMSHTSACTSARRRDRRPRRCPRASSRARRNRRCLQASTRARRLHLKLALLQHVVRFVANILMFELRQLLIRPFQELLLDHEHDARSAEETVD